MLASAALVACAALIAGLGSYAWRHRPPSNGIETAPVALRPADWRAVLTVAATGERSCPPSVPVVVLYVSSTCPHCLAEFGRWRRLMATGQRESSCIGFAIVAAPVRGTAGTEWLPRELTPVLLWDHDGTIARSLDVRMVPLAAYVTRNGIALSRVAGETADSAKLQQLARLRAASTSATGIH
jgi:hypothetical protein